MQQSTSTTPFRLIPVLLILLCAGFGFSAVLWQSFFGPPFVPRLGDPIGLRGNNIAILRLPTNPIQEIAIYEDGQAIRYAYPIQPNVYAQVQLSLSEKQEFEQLRVRWCKQIPPLRQLAPQESFYDIAFRCGVSGGTQAKVPVDMLPAFFEDLRKQLPNSAA